MTIDQARTINDALKRHDYDDWYQALLTAAMVETEGDIVRSIQIADETYAQGGGEDAA